MIYIHIPYCDSKCYYCNFNSYVDKFDSRKRYMEALLVQFESEIKRFNLKKKSLQTLFIGGGTPSTIPTKLYKDIFAKLNYFLKNGAEITTEANPNSATKMWLEGMKNIGVNRISFGIQSFNAEKLSSLGRNHTPKMAIDAIKTAKSVGFDNISIDLIYNYKDDTESLLKNDIDTALKLGVSHISAYELTVELNTVFEKSFQYVKNDEDISQFVSLYIQSQGLKQYEVSNYGKISLHNLGYWKLKNYVGLGAGAVGFLDEIRIYPQKSIDDYIKNPNLIYIEELSRDDLTTERIFLGLRSSVGVEIEPLPNKIKDRIKILLMEKRLYQKGKRVFNPNYFLADEITLFLIY